MGPVNQPAAGQPSRQLLPGAATSWTQVASSHPRVMALGISIINKAPSVTGTVFNDEGQ